MTPPRPTSEDFLRIGSRIRVMPIIHGAGDFAVRVREELLNRKYDCLAVPLPPSFKEDVEAAIGQLPAIHAVVHRDADGDGDGYSYLPIAPRQSVIPRLLPPIGRR